ncbi:unnamed protein product [Arctogadus glacialis]
MAPCDNTVTDTIITNKKNIPTTAITSPNPDNNLNNNNNVLLILHPHLPFEETQRSWINPMPRWKSANYCTLLMST